MSNQMERMERLRQSIYENDADLVPEFGENKDQELNLNRDVKVFLKESENGGSMIKL